MPRWTNPDLRLYHGTDRTALADRAVDRGGPVGFTRSLARVRPFTDFGLGFYLTTRLHQARQWANAKVLRSRRSTEAVVLEFLVPRDRLAALEALCFVRESSDFWDLVYDCRMGMELHGRRQPAPPYDVVYGPVSLWPQLLTIADCDQVSFHTPRALLVLGSNPTLKDIANGGACFDEQSSGETVSGS